MIYYGILIGMTMFWYRSQMVDAVSESMANNLTLRLNLFSQSIATSVYQMDRQGILATQRLALAYSEAEKVPYPIADGAFKMVSQTQFRDGSLSG